MPPKAVKTIRDLIYWEYAKLISDSAGFGRKQYPFVMKKFNELRKGIIKWSDILREDLQVDKSRCVYCESQDNLTNDHIVPKRECHFREIHNIVIACNRCNSAKGDKDVIKWYGLDRRYEIPRVVMGKFLKMIYICHECRDTLNKSDINKDNILNVLDLGHILQEECVTK